MAEWRKGEPVQYIVLTPAYEDLYEDIATLFAEWPDVVVTMDRDAKRRGARHVSFNLSMMCRGVSNAAGNA
jgi:hypothetical protein